MLVLSRKVGEKIVIGDNVTVVIKRIAGNRVTVGIEAPTDIHVVRGELKPFHREEAMRHAILEIDTNPAYAMAVKPR